VHTYLQVANKTYEIARRLADLNEYKEQTTNEVKYLIRQGFDQLSEKLVEAHEYLHRELAKVVTQQKNEISYLKQVRCSKLLATCG